eukprot:2564991-Pyramimonas_sp.AAC.2
MDKWTRNALEALAGGAVAHLQPFARRVPQACTHDSRMFASVCRDGRADQKPRVTRGGHYGRYC